MGRFMNAGELQRYNYPKPPKHAYCAALSKGVYLIEELDALLLSDYAGLFLRA